MQRIPQGACGRDEWPGLATVCGVTFRISGALRLAKVGQYVGVAPAAGTQGLPAFEIFPVTTDVDHAVDGGGPTDNSSTRAGDAAIVQSGLWGASETPVVVRVADG